MITLYRIKILETPKLVVSYRRAIITRTGFFQLSLVPAMPPFSAGTEQDIELR